MRLTLLRFGKRTYREKLQYLAKLQWRDRGSKLVVDRLRVPKSLLDDPKNPLHKAENMFTSTRYDDLLAEEIEIGVSPKEAEQLKRMRTERLAMYSPFIDDPRYHPNDEPCLIYSDKRRFCKGLDQASLLTNTVVFKDSPPRVNGLIKKFSDSVLNADSSNFDLMKWQHQLQCAVERAVLHAHVWHTNETKLPRRFQPELPIWKHKAEYGIHPEQVTRFLFHNLFRIIEFQIPQFLQIASINCDSLTAAPIDYLPPRWTTRDSFIETYYNFGIEEKQRIHFAVNHDLSVNGEMPNPSFLHDTEIAEICRLNSLPVSSLGPVSPLIDLTSTQYYRKDSTDGWIGNGPRRYPHLHLVTINLSLPNTWSDFLEPEADPVTPEQRQASALMHCYASAIAYARSVGLDNGNLVTPICVQGICSDGVFFDFMAFQLNTLDVPDLQNNDSNIKTNSIRNVAWIDGNYRLVNKCVPKRSMLRNTKYYDLDMKVFYRLVGHYLWGLVGDQLHMSTSSSVEVGQNVAN